MTSYLPPIEWIAAAWILQYVVIGCVLAYTRRVAWRLRVRRNIRLIELYGTRKPV